MKVTQMKNTVRIPLNGATKPAPAQSQNAFDALIQGSPELLARIEKIPMSERQALASDLEKLAALCRGKAQAAPKIPKGFVLVNLSTWEQKDMRALSRAAGITLRDALRKALLQTRRNLKEWAKTERLTGLTGARLYNFCCAPGQLN